MSATTVIPAEAGRTSRLTALVSPTEAERIARKAAEAGLSVSAYLRDRALGLPPEASDSAALRQFDTLLQRMETDLDSAIATLSATIDRLHATP